MLWTGRDRTPKTVRALHTVIAATHAMLRTKCTGTKHRPAGSRNTAAAHSPVEKRSTASAGASASAMLAGTTDDAPAARGGDRDRARGNSQGRHWSLQHHREARHIVTCDALRVPCHEVEAAVSKPILLPRVVDDAFAPVVNALGIVAIRQAITSADQAVAEVVVVAVAQVLVEEPDVEKRRSPVDGVPRAHVIGRGRETAITKRQIERHHARPDVAGQRQGSKRD